MLRLRVFFVDLLPQIIGIFVSVRSAVVSNRLKMARGTLFDNPFCA